MPGHRLKTTQGASFGIIMTVEKGADGEPKTVILKRYVFPGPQYVRVPADRVYATSNNLSRRSGIRTASTEDVIEMFPVMDGSTVTEPKTATSIWSCNHDGHSPESDENLDRWKLPSPYSPNRPPTR
ncbi:MAG: hypothetical protein AAFO70_08945 [Pseudomonadota bacterium]